MTAPLYRLEDLSVSFPATTVLDRVSLSIAPGEIVGILGMNGAGKTTLLEVLAFLRPPSGGRISFDGTPVNGARAGGRALRGRAVLVQQDPILFTSTVADNVAYPLHLRKVSKTVRKQKVLELLRQVGMERFIHASADTLSGGETQRAAIAMALACEPDVILFDEPTSSVDAENTRMIEELIRAMNRERNVTVLFSTHEREQARRLAGRTLFLAEGGVFDAPPENVWRVTLEGPAGGDALCDLGGLVFRIPTALRGAARISIPPREVIANASAPVNEENTIPGRIRLIADEGETVRLKIEGALPITASLSPDRFNRAGLNIGDAVWISCPPEKIRVWT